MAKAAGTDNGAPGRRLSPFALACGSWQSAVALLATCERAPALSLRATGDWRGLVRPSVATRAAALPVACARCPRLVNCERKAGTPTHCLPTDAATGAITMWVQSYLVLAPLTYLSIPVNGGLYF